MKKLITLALIGTFSIASYAQPNKREVSAQLTPAQLAELQVKKMALRLDLNKSQQTKLRSFMEKGIKSRQEAMKAKKEAKPEDRTNDKEIRFKRQIAELDQKLAYQTELKSILNESQYSQWKKTQGKARGEKFQRGKRGRQEFSRRGNRLKRDRFTANRRSMMRGKTQRQGTMKRGKEGRERMLKKGKDRRDSRGAPSPKN